MNFTKTKFLSLPTAQQHKKRAELLRQIYELNSETLLTEYNQLQSWLNEPSLVDLNREKIADRFHEHLKKAEFAVSEHQLLSSIKKNDRETAAPLWPIAIYLDQLRSAFNVGSILRTVEALSLGTVYFSQSTPNISHKQVQKAAMGTEKWMKVYSDTPLEELPKPIIALELSSYSVPLYQFIFPETFTLVLGNEEYGCSAASLAQANYLIEIPMRGRKNSLNVANAFAIVAGEIQRQKQMKILSKDS